MNDAFSAVDHLHMAQALRLAELGLYTTSPNPRVGCVVTQGEAVVGTGWHQYAGEPHAEIFALRAAAELARGATVYVTLEPCAHYGRTPPCADALIAAGVARVVVATEDPFRQVAGRGLAKLAAAGICVQTGLMREAARELNIGFFRRIEHGRPFVRLKLAMSLDGRTALANGQSKWITGEPARADVHHWRARASAILTGSGTVLADDPQLCVRLPSEVKYTPPLRIVLDRCLRTPTGARILDDSAPTLILHDATLPAPLPAKASINYSGVAIDATKKFDLSNILALLAQRDINELHVEAGARLGGALWAAGLVDELLLYVAPLLLGDSARPLLHLPELTYITKQWRMHCIEQCMVGDDWRLRLRPQGHLTAMHAPTKATIS